MSVFTENLLQKFEAIAGAGSEVTVREATGDKSVTLDRFEKTVLHLAYPADTFTRAGGAAKDGLPTHQTFNVLNTHLKKYEQHQLAIKYPKASGNELRLYFNRESNFYPEAGNMWFIFTRPDEPIPYIGFMPVMEWENVASGEEQKLAYEESYSLDDDDDFYQKELHSPQAQAGTIQQSSTKYARNPSLAASAIKKAHYKCEYDEEHSTFISAASGESYVEVHHLIPISQSGKFQYSLDVPANMVVLCPNCHRAIHFGTTEVKRVYLRKFYDERIEYLTQAEITVSFEELCSYYGA
jgi:5-methylcytosine-specific restriction protein A